MHSAIFALLIFMVLTVVGRIESAQGTHFVPSTATRFARAEGESFLAYRNAVRSFIAINPTFTGSVSQAQLQSMGFTVPPILAGKVGNLVTVNGSSGRVVTCFASLAPSALAHAREVAGFDASLGVANGSSWTSLQPGAVAQPLPQPVAAGNAVSVLVFGS